MTFLRLVNERMEKSYTAVFWLLNH